MRSINTLQPYTASFFRPSMLSLHISIAVLILSGCSGGGSSQSNTTAVVTPPTPEAPSTPASPYTVNTVSQSSLGSVQSTAQQTPKVGIIDSGITASNSNFADNDIHFRSVFYRPEEPFDSRGEFGHGTQVALTIDQTSKNSELYVAQTSNAGEINSDYTSMAINWLLDEDVKVINASYGATARLSLEDLTAQRDSYAINKKDLQNIVAHDALLVQSTGNEGTMSPAPNVLIPVLYPEDPDLQKGIIAVTGYMPGWERFNGSYGKDGKARPSELNGFDACGEAAAYCMSAIGYVDYTDAKGESKRELGTSFAAPRVSAAAAEVNSKYPWMTGYNLQQTLLTTARYHSDAYTAYNSTTGEYQQVADSSNGRPYNNTFGWGDLDLAKALKGPAMFYADNFNADLSAGDYSFSNNISGDYGLIVGGAADAGGRLRLTGNNSYKGDTQVNANQLFVDGSIAGNAETTGSGVLAGKGSIAGNVNNAGVVATTAEGALTIQGDYTQTAQGTLSISLSQPLNVKGKANLDGKLEITAPNDQYVVKTSETLLNSDGGVSGTFDVVNGLFLKGDVSYSDHSVQATLSRANTVDAMQTQGISNSAILQSASNVESALVNADQLSSASNLNSQQSAFMRSAAAFEQISNLSSAQNSLNSLSGQAYTSNNSILFNVLDYQNQLLDNRVQKLQSSKQHGVWFESGILEGDLSKSGYLASDYEVQSFAVGIDHRVIDSNLWLGLGYSNSTITADYAQSGGQSENQLHSVLAYGLYYLNPQWYAQTQLSYQHGKNKLTRSIVLDDVQSVLSDTSSDSWQALLKTGFEYHLKPNLQIQPYAGLKYSYLSTGKFSETGEGFNLSGNGDDYQRTVGLAGLKLAWHQDLGNQLATDLSLYAEAQHAFNNPDLNASAYWSALGEDSSSITIPGISLARDSQAIGAKFNLNYTDTLGFFLRGDQIFSARGDQHSFRIGMNWLF